METLLVAALLIVAVWILFISISCFLYVAGDSVIVLAREYYLEKKYKDSSTISEEDFELMEAGEVVCEPIIFAAVKKFKTAWDYTKKARES